MRFSALGVGVVLTLGILCSSCPFGGGNTFDFPIANLGPYSLTELKITDSNSGNFVNVLSSSVPANTLQIIKLDRSRFGDNLSEMQYSTDKPETDGFVSVVVQAGHTGFRYEEANGQTSVGLMSFDDQTKSGIGMMVQDGL